MPNRKERDTGRRLVARERLLGEDWNCAQCSGLAGDFKAAFERWITARGMLERIENLGIPPGFQLVDEVFQARTEAEGCTRSFGRHQSDVHGR